MDFDSWPAGTENSPSGNEPGWFTGFDLRFDMGIIVLLDTQVGKSKMIVHGVVQNGIIIPIEPLNVPEGTRVTIEIVSPDVVQDESSSNPRQGGWWNGQVTIATDFDELPDDIREAFGMNER